MKPKVQGCFKEKISRRLKPNRHESHKAKKRNVKIHHQRVGADFLSENAHQSPVKGAQDKKGVKFSKQLINRA